MAIQCMYNQYESFHLKTVSSVSTAPWETVPFHINCWFFLSLLVVIMIGVLWCSLSVSSSSSSIPLCYLSFQFHSQKCGLQHNQQQNLTQFLQMRKHFILSFLPTSMRKRKAQSKITQNWSFKTFIIWSPVPWFPGMSFKDITKNDSY